MTRLTLLAALGATAIGMLLASALLGSSELSMLQAFAALWGGGDETARIIVWEIRLPRALAALGVGMALGSSGALMQGLLRNPLAEPGVLGVSASASLGAIIALYFGISVLGAFTVPVFAILGALAATGVLSGLASVRISAVQLILAGVGLSSFAGALGALAMNLAPNRFALSDMVSWMLGSVTNRSLDDLVFVAPFWLAGGVLALLTAPHLRALALGEETAQTLGVDLARTRVGVIGAAALLTGAAVAISGVIGFVGIVAPHIVRPFVRHDPSDLVWPSAFLGGVLITLADLVLRLVPLDQELRLGVMVSLIGAPVFILIAARSRGMGR
ncbi:FecCD family ABC transporter permease [Oceanicaulis alexandrii]|uniref:FecCD family ABC transporter permease n=1 Tax=Oceanicaulis alexandrii TaxID=153233 RepID=UPI0003B42EB6|nr:iron ABC transporter permease [Oceanicaulis alexandrii]|tara:strand:+ start:183 stop:1172 length:990 start_codon:yes stop_codon:yes gene_type:complete